MTGLDELARRLGVEVDEAMLEHALMHRSFAYENGGLPTNERLEFLGDSVLGLVVTDALYRRHPDLAEGQLAKLRAAVVNMRALAGVGRELGLGAFIMLGRGEEASGGRRGGAVPRPRTRCGRPPSGRVPGAPPRPRAAQASAAAAASSSP